MTDTPPDPSTYEGEEGRPATPPKPVRYQPAPTGDVAASDMTTSSGEATRSAPPIDPRIMAASGPIATVLFFVFGFAGGWSWSWVFFLLPGVLYAWNRGAGSST